MGVGPAQLVVADVGDDLDVVGAARPQRLSHRPCAYHEQALGAPTHRFDDGVDVLVRHEA